MSAPDLAALLEALPHGKTVWVEVRGRSMWPLLWPGDMLKVERCAADLLERGDVAVLRRDDGALVSHLVHHTAPLTTVSFVGRPDHGLTPLGRATAVKRSGVTAPLPRAPISLLQRVWSFAAHSPLQSAWRTAVEVATSTATLPGRRLLLGVPQAQLLGPDALHEVALALSRWESPAPEALTHALGRGRVAGARGRSGALVAVALEDRAHVLERYRGFGLEDALLRLLRRL
ncbi:MAG: S24 family peptidase [Archangiaceae bacterium]|nr:S24 family peptidase [Archangiaceae bacterium]